MGSEGHNDGGILKNSGSIGNILLLTQLAAQGTRFQSKTMGTSFV